MFKLFESQGKTTELVYRCATEGGYIVCFNRQEAHRVFHEVAKKEGVFGKIPFPLTPQEALRCHVAGVKKLHVDNADLVLQMMLPAPIVSLTANPFDHD